MQTSSLDARSLARDGFDALRRGDARAARDAFERVAASGAADAAIDLGLAYACRRLNDDAAALAAVDKALAAEPRNPRALILKGDCLAAGGDARAASAFYSFATQVAPPDADLPADLRAELARARTMCERYAAEFERFLLARLDRDGAAGQPSARRFRHSLDILLGRKRIYFQQPRTFFFAELPQVQFYPREAFPWLDAVEGATDDIRRELRAVIADPSAFAPYIEANATRPRKENDGLQGNADWSAFYLWKNGEPVAPNIERCPRTMAALAGAPLAAVGKRSPSVLFSLLRPRSRIPPHTGRVNTRLICHLPLIVPPGCGFRVGNETRTPVEGRAWTFDDTIEHEAWNDSESPRVILIFDVWRPELTREERDLVATMFEAIDAYGQPAEEWSA